MAYRILTNDIIMLNHKAFVDNTLESHRFHNSEIQSAVMKPELFHIVVPYDGKPTRDEAGDKRKSRKRKRVEDNLDEITQKVKDKHLEYLGLLGLTEGVTEGSNSIALEFIDKFNRSSYYDVDNVFSGANESQFIVNTVINNEDFIIPSNCRFFNTDVRNLSDHITIEDRFDLIVMDPPWWNKYIRRTKAVNEQSGYRMLDNESLKSIPLENHIHDRTIVAIWCTNSPTHISAIEEQFCPKWNLKLVGSWFWTKVTEHGMPVCSFNETTKKQPYERLFIAVSSDSSIKNIPRERYIFSVPCAIHSNKPPLLDLFADLLPERPKCLELFARNVYPNFTSIGTEVLKLQNSRLFQLSLKHEVQ
ncbi:N(6)-adenine-specific methyltransferase METTL4 isoform X1 [Armigeres subalbatus]|uniref:N(6)-adenine-specific methyltransferase METTL4 isoform X1 n=1 Tax=Armigeres subalbatus TaxID=124917 RepID=UPI002ED54AA7